MFQDPKAYVSKGLGDSERWDLTGNLRSLLESDLTEMWDLGRIIKLLDYEGNSLAPSCTKVCVLATGPKKQS